MPITYTGFGLFLYLFDHQHWFQIYKENCTHLSTLPQDPNIFIGLTYSLVGVLCEIVYVPFMIVMWQMDFINTSCYKFMFLLGIVDMATIPFTAISPGVQAVLGIHYCAIPDYDFFRGSMTHAGWFGTCATCVLLAIDRFSIFFFPGINEKVFNKDMMTLWLCVPLIWAVIGGFFTPSPIFNPKIDSFSFDPYFGLDNYTETYSFESNIVMHTNSAITVVILGLCYAALCVGMFLKTKVFRTQTVSKAQKIMFYQSFCICWEIFAVALLYVSAADGYITFPVWFMPILHLALILTHGDTPIVYMIFNKTLRQEVMRWLKKKILQASYSTAIHPSIDQAQPQTSRTAPSIEI